MSAIDPSIYRLLRRSAIGLVLGCEAVALAVVLLRGAASGLLLASLALPTTGLIATVIVDRARNRPDGRPGRMARRPQAVIVPLGAILALVTLWSTQSLVSPSLPPGSLQALGAAAIVLAFPILVLQRSIAGISTAMLPEASALATLLAIPAALWPLIGVLAIGQARSWPYLRLIATFLQGGVALVAAELALRALANWFLPPPLSADARAAVGSFAARLARPASLARHGLAKPIQSHFGIDFARSWALAYSRAAALPLLGLVLLVAWGLSGAGLVPLDARAVEERFGAPVAVRGPGLHVVLPWPLGRLRLVEYGVVHATLIGELSAAGEASARDAPPPAENPPPPGADRLWEQLHPTEQVFLIGSHSASGQSFQTVSADIRVLWRVGINDSAALQARYALDDPDAFVRAEASRLVGRYFAAQTLDGVLGAGREQTAETLRAALQAEVEAARAGLEILAIVIEAIHPPAEAAEAYHQVQAAEIQSRMQIDQERGQAIALDQRTRAMAFTTISDAEGLGAEAVNTASASASRFMADVGAATSGGPAFSFERYLDNLAAALPKASLTIIDHRLSGADGPVLDLRQLGAAARATTGDED